MIMSKGITVLFINMCIPTPNRNFNTSIDSTRQFPITTLCEFIMGMNYLGLQIHRTCLPEERSDEGSRFSF